MPVLPKPSSNRSLSVQRYFSPVLDAAQLLYRYHSIFYVHFHFYFIFIYEQKKKNFSRHDHRIHHPVHPPPPTAGPALVCSATWPPWLPEQAQGGRTPACYLRGPISPAKNEHGRTDGLMDVCVPVPYVCGGVTRDICTPSVSSTSDRLASQYLRRGGAGTMPGVRRLEAAFPQEE